MKKPTTVLLAAGSGKRLGGPKALLAWPHEGKDRPLAIAHAEARLAAESERVLVVVRREVMGELLGHVRPGIDLVVSSAPDEAGPAGSLAVALPKLGDAELVIVTPVDAPPPRAETVKKLIERLDADPTLLAARPRYGGKSGHPVALRRGGLARFEKADPPPLRDHLRALGDRCADVDVSDSSVLIDLNTPADVMGVLGALPRFVRG